MPQPYHNSRDVLLSDVRGRVLLGSEASRTYFHVERAPGGVYILSPLNHSNERDKLLENDPKAPQSIKRGIAQTEANQLVSVDFSSDVE